MMSRCKNCGTPTDLAITDVMTKEELDRYPNIPLFGTCGEEKCNKEILLFYKERENDC